jgi:hypothetical protein
LCENYSLFPVIQGASVNRAMLFSENRTFVFSVLNC